MIDKVVSFIQSHKAKLTVAAVLIVAALVVDFIWFPAERSQVLSNGVKVVLQEKACKLQNVLDAVTDQYRDQLKAGYAELGASFNNEVRELCYLEIGGQITGMDSVGIQFTFDAADFK